MIDSTDILLIYVIDSLYYVSLSILLFYYYLKYRKYIYNIDNNIIINVRVIEKFSMFDIVKIIKHIVKRSSKWSFLLIVISLVLGYFSYKLDYEYECKIQNNTNSTVINNITNDVKVINPSDKNIAFKQDNIIEKFIAIF